MHHNKDLNKAFELVLNNINNSAKQVGKEVGVHYI